MTVQPFSINVEQAVLDDLQTRLAQTRWPDEVEGAGWDYGTDLTTLKQLVSYWQTGYDWRAQEAKLNQFPQFRTEIDGLGIHFVHVCGKGPNPLPLILTHGWPDSFYRMVKVIPMLADPASYGGDPADAFDVIVPSLPGYGFSDRPHQRGVTSKATADLWAKLMSELGYSRFGAAGGDVGSEVTLWLAHNHPDLLAGIHLTDVSYPMAPPEGAPMNEAAQKYLGELQQWFQTEAAYMMEQSSKPQTVSYGLNDSPVGLAAWIIEKFQSWGANHGNLGDFFSDDELLTNVMIYWATQTISSSARMYAENAHSGNSLWPAPRIEVPVGVAHFNDLIPPREWVEQAMNLVRWTEIGSGGHFAAMTAPDQFVTELREFFRPLRTAAK